MSTAFSNHAAYAAESNEKSLRTDSQAVNGSKSLSKSSKSASADHQLNEFASELYLLVPKFIAVLIALTDRNPGEVPSLEKLTRSLLLGGAGRGFDDSITHGIRYYKYADAAVRKYSRPDSHACDTERADILAIVSRDLRRWAEDLKMLQVEIIEPKPGDPVDPELHQVDLSNQRETSDPRKVNLIAEVQSPAFRWLGEAGTYTTDPAEVILFVEKKSLSRTRKPR